MLRNGENAPQFALNCQDGTQHTLEDYRGKPVVLIFIRGEFCPTAHKSLHMWQNFYGSIKGLNAELVAISHDTCEVSKQLHDKYTLSYPIFSDTDLVISKQYGVYIDTYKEVPYGEPALVVVDRDGQVAYSVISSGPKGLPTPEDISSILVYMSIHGGKY